MRKCVIPLVVVTLILTIAALPGCGGSQNTETEEPGNQVGETEIITKAEYDQTAEGMTYDQVVEIVGGPGKLLKEQQKSDGSTTTLIYYWRGNGGAASQAELSFEGGKLIYRLQSGLQ